MNQTNGVLQDLPEGRAWMLVFGCLLILAGILAIAYSVVIALVSVVFLACLLIGAGVLEAAFALRCHARGNLLFYAVEALLSIATGFLLLRSPAIGLLAITLLLAGYFVITGIFRIVAALAFRSSNWGWTVSSGLVTLALGIVVWGGWPASGFWMLGLFIGVNLLMSGWARVMLALALRPHRLTPHAV